MDELTTLYTYYCVDGMVRTRCRRHIETTGPYRILAYGRGIYHQKDVAGALRCVRCHWEYLHRVKGEGDDQQQGGGRD
jgi:hypothetical protein